MSFIVSKNYNLIVDLKIKEIDMLWQSVQINAKILQRSACG